MKSKEKKEKLSFREWCEHVWYYYKWQILILGLIAVFIIIATVQLFKKTDPDGAPMYSNPRAIQS